MAQLPDENVIAFPTPGSARRPSTIDVGGYARGAAAAGAAYETLGKGITSAANDVAVMARKEREADDKLELARANGYLNTALLNHRNAIDRETNADGLVENYTTIVKDNIDTAAKSISNPRARELFTLYAQDNAARVINAAKSKSFKLSRDAGMAVDVATMNQLREIAIAGGPEAVTTFVNGIHGYVEAWRTKGWIDRVQAGELKRSQAEQFARGKLATLPAAERLEALHGRARFYGIFRAILPEEVRKELIADAEREQS
jgi:hypothetical protein